MWLVSIIAVDPTDRCCRTDCVRAQKTRNEQLEDAHLMYQRAFEDQKITLEARKTLHELCSPAVTRVPVQ